MSNELDSSTAMSKTAVGTIKYMSPERLLGQRYDKSGDIWSVGIMMLELWNKQYPFPGSTSNPIDLLSELEQLNLEDIFASGQFPPLMQDVVYRMLAIDQSARGASMDLISCEWFTQFNLTTLGDAQAVGIYLHFPSSVPSD